MPTICLESFLPLTPWDPRHCRHHLYSCQTDRQDHINRYPMELRHSTSTPIWRGRKFVPPHNQNDQPLILTSWFTQQKTVEEKKHMFSAFLQKSFLKKWQPSLPPPQKKKLPTPLFFSYTPFIFPKKNTTSKNSPVQNTSGFSPPKILTTTSPCSGRSIGLFLFRAESWWTWRWKPRQRGKYLGTTTAKGPSEFQTNTLQGINIPNSPPDKAYLKMIFLFPQVGYVDFLAGIGNKERKPAKKTAVELIDGPLNSKSFPFVVLYWKSRALAFFRRGQETVQLQKGYTTWRFRMSYKMFLRAIALLIETSAIDTSQSGCHRPVALVKRLCPEVFHNMHGLPSGKLT